MSFRFFSSSAKQLPALEAEQVHHVAGRELPLRVVENARAKRLTLRIDAGGQSLRVTIPPGLRQGEVKRFLDRHHDWLELKLSRLPDRPQLRAGVKMPLRGRPHLIIHQPGKRGTVTAGIKDSEPVLYVHGEETHLPRRLADFLKREAKKDIEPLVAKHSASVGRPAKTIRFKDTSSRWGSCTSEGNLSFSWRIMMAPPTVIDYLVAHEVAHLREMNHGPDFWALCRELCPRTDEARSWLKRNGSALQAIAFG